MLTHLAARQKGKAGQTVKQIDNHKKGKEQKRFESLRLFSRA